MRAKSPWSRLTLCGPTDYSHQVCPWDSPSKNTRVGYRALLQGIFLIEPMSLASPALAGSSLPLAPPGKPTVGFTMEQFFTQNPTFQGSLPQTSPDSPTMSHCRHDPNPAEGCPHPTGLQTIFSPMTPWIIPSSPVPIPS